MTEQKQENKKAGLTKRIFRGIGLSALTLLILLALVFEVSLKIIILLVIILASFTALPKPARKWFWLSVGVIVIALIVWIFLPEDDEGWRPYTFDKELVALEAKYAIPDEENAATIYNELMESHTLDELQTNFLNRKLDNITLNEQWTSKEHPKLAHWLQEQQDIMDRLLQATRKDKCQLKINVQYIVTDKLEINRYSVLRDGCCLLIRAGNNDMAEGRIDPALQKYICVLRITNHLFQQPRMLDFRVGFQLEDLVLTQLNRFVVESEPTAEQLKLITESLNNLENNWNSDFNKGFERDRLFWKNVFGHFYEINDRGNIRINRDPSGSIIRFVFFRRNLIRYMQRIKSNKFYIILAWSFLPSTPQEAGNIVDAILDGYHSMAQPEHDWHEESKQQELRFKLNYRNMVEAAIIDNDCIGHYRDFHDRYLRQIILRRGSRLLIAIKQYENEHGNWPDSLDSIKSYVPHEAFLDPVTEEPLQYENHGERFSLYGEATNIWPR